MNQFLSKNNKEAVAFNDVRIFYRANQLFCRFPDEDQDRILRSRIQDIQEGDCFLIGTGIHTADFDAHQNHDEPDSPWIVYDCGGEGWFEEDVENAEERFSFLEKEPLTVNSVLVHRRRDWENASWIDHFLVDSSLTPSKDLFEKAIRDFLFTKDGLEAIENTCHDFNWGDAMVYVPQDIWNKHGIYTNSDGTACAQFGLIPDTRMNVIIVDVNQDEILIPDELLTRVSKTNLDNRIKTAQTQISNQKPEFDGVSLKLSKGDRRK